MCENERIELYILHKVQMIHTVLPANSVGRIRIDLGIERQSVLLQALKQQWHFVMNDHFQMVEGKQKYVPINLAQNYVFTYDEEIYHAYTMPYNKDTHRFHELRCLSSEFTIGRGEECDIVYPHSAVSYHHATVFKDSLGWSVRDEGSSNGTFLNDLRIQQERVRSKDKVQILQLTILFKEDSFFINAPVDIHFSNRIQPFQEPTQLVKTKRQANCQFQMMDMRVFSKPTHSVDLPPSLNEENTPPLVLVLGPTLTMGLSSLSMGLFALIQVRTNKGNLMQSIPTLIMSFSMALGSILWPLLSRRYSRQQLKKQQQLIKESYLNYLETIAEEIRLEINSYQEQQRTLYGFLSEAYEKLNQGIRLIYDKDSKAYNTITLGTGDLFYKVSFTQREKGFLYQQEELMKQYLALINADYQAKSIPIVIHLNECKQVWIVGENRQSFLLNLLFEFAVYHSHSDSQIVLYMSEESSRKSGARLLPQVFDKEEGKRNLFCDRESLNLKKKKTILFSFYDDALSLNEEENKNCILQCSKQTRNVSSSSAFISLDKQQGTLYYQHQQVSFQYQLKDDATLKEIAQKLVQQNKSISFQQNKSVHFLDMYRCGSVKELNINERWSQSSTINSLQVCIGKQENEEPLLLDIHEKAHGAHGLIAGMTGSGKSECLITLILSLCVNYSPWDVNFLLIDYKGGTMSATLEKLPHVVGVVNNLETSQLQRVFFALQNEMVRRQKLMSETSIAFDLGNMDIAQYAQLSRSHLELKVLPHLVIIADEFAELKSQQAPFMDQLKQMARIGRSLGIHLLLATQKPAGVIDEQIWSNAHFHLCMKVQSVQDSRDMLKREDGAYLKKAGECCFQVGYDEVFKKGSIAWSRCPYVEKEGYEPQHFDEVMLLDNEASIVDKRHIQPLEKSHQTQMEAIIKEIQHIYKRENRKVEKLWQDPFPKTVSLPNNSNAFLMIDDIKQQKQYAYSFHEEEFTHTFLMGCEEDINVFIKSFLYSFVHNQKKERIYILDLAGQELTIFKNHRCIIEVLSPLEKEKIESLFYHIETELKQQENTQNDPPLLLILLKYEVFHECYEEWEEVLQHLLRDGKKKGMFLILSALSTTSLPYRYVQYPHNSIVFHMQEESERSQIFSQSDVLQPIDHVGAGLLLLDNEVKMFQTMTVTTEQIQALKQEESWQKSYQIPILPKHIAHKTNEEGLYLGKDVIRIQDVVLSLQKPSLIYIMAAYQLPKNSLALWKTQLYQNKECCLVRPECIVYQGKEHPLSCFSKFNAFVSIFLWERSYACEDERIQDYLKEEIMREDKVQIFLFTMREQMSYTRYEWFHLGFVQAQILWCGKGFNEVRHLFQNPSIPQGDLKKNQGYLIQEEVWLKLQLWEEIENG